MDINRGGVQLDMDRGLSKSSPSSPITEHYSDIYCVLVETVRLTARVGCVHVG